MLVCSLFEGSVGAYTLWTPRQNLAGSRGQDEPEQEWHGLRAAKASGLDLFVLVKQFLFTRLSAWTESLIVVQMTGKQCTLSTCMIGGCLVRTETS